MSTPAPAAVPSSPRRRRRTRRLVVAGVAVLGVGAATLGFLPGSAPSPAAAAVLVPFQGCDELGTWFADAASDLVGPYGLTGDGGGIAVMEGTVDAGAAANEAGAAPGRQGLAADEAAGAGGAVGAGAVGAGATGTNVQTEGVDEPDVVKTDGTRLVTVSGDRLTVFDVTGDTPRQTGELVLPAYGTELLLLGDRALVVGGGGYDIAAASDRAMPYGGGATGTVLTVVDLAGEPTVVRSQEVEGGYLSAREREGAVRVVLTTTPILPFVMPGYSPDGTPNDLDEDAAAARNREVLAAATGEDWLPHVVQRNESGKVTSREPLMSCDEVSHPADPSGLAVISVSTLDLAAPDAPLLASTGVAADGDMVYASADRLYVATTRGGWSPLGGVDADAAVTTALHGFDISDRSRATYLASGDVEGWLLGRWALSAQDGYLRVATTRGPRWQGDATSGQETESAVTVLAESGDRLEPVGSVGGLGVGEQIRAVRWFGPLAVVVTFRQTDPLYTVDLSDPTAPVVRGELKVPGYSAYLHPLGDGMLLGVGQDATEDGGTLGTQVATYDISDVGSPSQLDVLVAPGTSSDVEWDSRAFGYLPASRTALVPVSGERGPSLRGLTVSADGALTESGRYEPGQSAYLVRAVPLDENRVAAVVQTFVEVPAEPEPLPVPEPGDGSFVDPGVSGSTGSGSGSSGSSGSSELVAPDVMAPLTQVVILSVTDLSVLGAS